MKVVKGEDVLEASKDFCKGKTRQHYYKLQLKGKILVDEASLRSQIKLLEKDVKANLISSWMPKYLKEEILGEKEASN